MSAGRISPLSAGSFFHCPYYSRPSELNKAIDSAFATAQKLTLKKDYICTGSPVYRAHWMKLGLECSSTELIEARVGYSTLKVLDIGAGDFSFADFCQAEFKGEVSVHSVIAEKMTKTKDNQYTCNAEYLSSHFPAQSFDFIVSERTFIHLVDPLGSLIEAYKLLKPEGILMIDRLALLGIEAYSLSLIDYLNEAGYPCVGEFFTQTQLLGNFILKKPLDKPELLLPILYSHVAPDILKQERAYYKPSEGLKYSGTEKYISKGRDLFLSRMKNDEILKLTKQYQDLGVLLESPDLATLKLKPLLLQDLILSLIANFKLPSPPELRSEELALIDQRAKFVGASPEHSLLLYLFEMDEFENTSPAQQFHLIMRTALEMFAREYRKAEISEVLKEMNIPFIDLNAELQPSTLTERPRPRPML